MSTLTQFGRRYTVDYGPQNLNSFDDKADAIANALDWTRRHGVRITVADRRHDALVFDTSEQDAVVSSRFGTQCPPVSDYVNSEDKHFVGPHWDDNGIAHFAWVDPADVKIAATV